MPIQLYQPEFSRSQKVLIKITTATLFIGAFIWNNLRIGKQDQKEWNVFNRAEIQGVIEGAGGGGRAPVWFTVDNSPEIFKFDPHLGPDGEEFRKFARQGDSVIKHAHGNVLYLIRNHQKYAFGFYSH